MLKVYSCLIASIILALIGTFVNYSLVIYNVYGQLAGFYAEILLMTVLCCGISYGFFRVSKLRAARTKIVHGIIVSLFAMFALWLIMDAHVPAAVKMFYGELSCPTCP